MSLIANLRNWAAQRMAVGLNSQTGQTLREFGDALSGTSTGGNVYETAAVEFAVGIIGRAAMAAEVRGGGATLDPHTMAQLFRETVLLGESVQLIDLNRRTNVLRLLPVATRPIITGGPAPESWRYEVRLPRPNGEDPLGIDQLPVRNVGAEGVIHVRYMPYRAAPWQGVSPLQSAGFTAETLARIERSLQDDAKMPTGGIMPQPDGISADGIDQILLAMNQGKGSLTLVETTANAFGLGKDAAPRRDWEQQRFGPMVPATSIQLWEGAMLAVLAALGVPPSLYTSQGAALRESYRHLFGSTIEPLAALIQAELSEKLEETVTIRFPERVRSDVSALSRGSRAWWNRGSPLSRCTTCSGSQGMPRSRSPYLILPRSRPGNSLLPPPLVATGQPDWQPWYHRGNLPEGLVIAGLH